MSMHDKNGPLIISDLGLSGRGFGWRAQRIKKTLLVSGTLIDQRVRVRSARKRRQSISFFGFVHRLPDRRYFGCVAFRKVCSKQALRADRSVINDPVRQFGHGICKELHAPRFPGVWFSCFREQLSENAERCVRIVGVAKTQ